MQLKKDSKCANISSSQKVKFELKFACNLCNVNCELNHR